MKKIFVTGLAFVLVIVASITGTLAWLTATTSAVTNTFTVGDINITLIETKKPSGETETNTDKTTKPVTDWSAKLIPGTTYHKNPVVAVLDTTTVDCYLFIKFDNGDPSKTWLDYTSLLDSDHGWTELTTGSNIWYREVGANDSNKQWSLLKDDQVKVKDTVTKDNMPSDEIELKYTAYAVQKDNLTVTEAWAKLTPAT